MGLINSINDISYHIQKQEKNQTIKEKIKEYERKNKIELLQALSDEINDYNDMGCNIYNDKVKERIIETILQNTRSGKTKAYRNTNETRTLLIENYFKIANTCESIRKKRDKKEAELHPQPKQTPKHAQQQDYSGIFKALKILTYILLAPFFLIIFTVVALTKNA